MVTASTPAWSGARSGLLGDNGAVNAAAQVNQLLGTHAETVIYQGVPILTPFGQNFNTPWTAGLRTVQRSQPFTMVGTTIGRVAIPLLPVGGGTDLIISLCADNAGVPGTIITRTRVPASWLTQLAAVNGTENAAATGFNVSYTGVPLALPQYNSLHIASPGVFAWPYPTTGTGLTGTSDISCYYGNYLVVTGGVLSGNAQSGVYTIGYDDAGNLSQAIPQQSLPAANDGTGAATVCLDPSSADTILVITGGAITGGGAATTAAYTASLDPNSGTIASWSTQAVLPTALNNHAAASYNGWVYLSGGSQSTAVTYGQVSNGQITAWNTGPSIPALRPNAYFVATNGFLFWIGGNTGTSFSSVYYCPINSDGSLGAWMAGPSTPVALFALDPTVAVTTGPYGIVVNNSGNLYTLGVGPTGPDIGWLGFSTSQVGISMGLAASTPGQWQYYGINYTNYDTFALVLAPRVSVPLPASGLTNGSTYHIVIDSAGEDPNNCVVTTTDLDTFPGNPTYLLRPKIAGGAWTPTTPTGYAIPIQIYDGSATGPIWHTWEDNGARIAMFANATTPDGRLLGLFEATAIPAPALNQWPTFTDGLGPWVVTGGALTLSAVHTRAELPQSALVTPTGSATLSYILSDLVPVYLFHGYTATSWWYSPTGYASCAVNINWYDATRAFISTSNGSVTAVAANTWTPITLTGTTITPPNTAAYAAIVNVESGTPSAASVFYISSSTLTDQSAPQESSVTQLHYPGAWPSPDNAIWPVTGSTTLA